MWFKKLFIWLLSFENLIYCAYPVAGNLSTPITLVNSEKSQSWMFFRIGKKTYNQQWFSDIHTLKDSPPKIKILKSFSPPFHIIHYPDHYFHFRILHQSLGYTLWLSQKTEIQPSSEFQKIIKKKGKIFRLNRFIVDNHWYVSALENSSPQCFYLPFDT